MPRQQIESERSSYGCKEQIIFITEENKKKICTGHTFITKRPSTMSHIAGCEKIYKISPKIQNILGVLMER